MEVFKNHEYIISKSSSDRIHNKIFDYLDSVGINYIKNEHTCLNIGNKNYIFSPIDLGFDSDKNITCYSFFKSYEIIDRVKTELESYISKHIINEINKCLDNYSKNNYTIVFNYFFKPEMTLKIEQSYYLERIFNNYSGCKVLLETKSFFKIFHNSSDLFKIDTKKLYENS